MSKMKRVGKVLRWFVLNSLFMSLLVAGALFEKQWAANIAIFYIWVVLIFTLLISFIPKNTERMRKEGPPVPLWIDVTIDLAAVFILAGKGWFFYATVYFVHIIFYVSIFYKSEENKPVSPAGSLDDDNIIDAEYVDIIDKK